MSRRLLALPFAALSLILLIGTAPMAHAASKPSKISATKAVPGPGVGEITVSWKSKRSKTTHFTIETALTNFNPSKKSSLPAHGLSAVRWTVSARTRSVTLSAATLASLGAPLASANHLYIRVTPYNGSRAGSGAKTISMFPRAQAPVGSGSWMRMVSYNVRSAPSTIGTSRAWPSRANTVAQSIMNVDPGIAVLQEVSPGPVTGRSGTARQTEDLVSRLHALGALKYEMVRTSPYVKAGTTMGTQGARILYDTSKYDLLSSCPETTDRYTYNPSCSVTLWGLPGESASKARSAAYAKFEDRASGQQFWVVSIHLDNRDGVKYENLRATQVSTALRALAAQNTEDLPVLLGGDFNSWQNNYPYNYAPHTVLTKAGFYDTAAAVTKVNMRYGTMNHFDTTLKPSSSVLGSRLDHIMVKGIVGSQKFVNVMAVSDAHRGSDHNMIYSEFRFR